MRLLQFLRLSSCRMSSLHRDQHVGKDNAVRYLDSGGFRVGCRWHWHTPVLGTKGSPAGHCAAKGLSSQHSNVDGRAPPVHLVCTQRRYPRAPSLGSRGIADNYLMLLQTSISHRASLHVAVRKTCVTAHAECRLGMDRLEAASQLCTLVFTCDLPLLRRYILAGVPVDAGDYDDRTALHISACESNFVVVRTCDPALVPTCTACAHRVHTPMHTR